LKQKQELPFSAFAILPSMDPHRLTALAVLARAIDDARLVAFGEKETQFLDWWCNVAGLDPGHFWRAVELSRAGKLRIGGDVLMTGAITPQVSRGRGT
jgi:hypothetical protein